MAEAMAVETILEADWQMQDFWTRLRFPLRTLHGGWSDIDLLAYHPESRHLVIAESKVQGPKKDVFAYTPNSRKKYGSILEYDKIDGKAKYFRFLDNLPLAYRDGAIFQSFRKMVRQLSIQLVSNYYIDARLKQNAAATIRDHVSRKLPNGVNLTIKLETTLDVILRILTAEGEAVQGRRYGHPIIDLARELNRYMRPNIRYAGRGNGDAAEVRSALSKQIVKSFVQSVGRDTLPKKRLPGR